MNNNTAWDSATQPHPRKIGWIITAALALGGSNLSLYLISGLMSGQGSAGVPLLILGILVSWMAIPCWTELMLLFPNRVGGIAAFTAAALKPYNPILACINGVGYWSCTVPGVSFSAVFFATAIQQWFFPGINTNLVATVTVLFFMGMNFTGIQWIGRFTVPFAIAAMFLTLLSGLVPVFFSNLSWEHALSYKLTTPFPGLFGQVTSFMAGLYLIAFSAPAFEQGLCYVGETINPNKNVPRLMKAILVITALYYILLPIVWYAALGTEPMSDSTLTKAILPIYSPLFHESAKFMAAAFVITNSIVCLISSLSCSSRTMLQLSEDGLVPEGLGLRSKKTDAPWSAVILTAAVSIFLIYLGNPNWLIAATNYEYIIAISLATVVVVVMRRIAPQLPRPYKASKLGITMGLAGVLMWVISLIFGFQQFGLTAVIVGIAFPFTGLLFYFWRKIKDHYKQGLPLVSIRSLHLKLTGTMLAVLALDSIGYLIAVKSLPEAQTALITSLEDIFVTVALLTLAIGLVVPAMVAHAASQVSAAANNLVTGTLADFARAMQALGRGELDKARARIDINPIHITSKDEIGQMGESFNLLQETVANAAVGLDGAREGLSQARKELLDLNIHLEERVVERTEQVRRAHHELEITLENLRNAQQKLVEHGKMAALGNLVAGVAHEVNTPLGICVTAISQLKSEIESVHTSLSNNSLTKTYLSSFIDNSDEAMRLIESNLQRASELIQSFKQVSSDNVYDQGRDINLKQYMEQILLNLKPVFKESKITVKLNCSPDLLIFTYPSILFQIMTILVINSSVHAFDDNNSDSPREITITISTENDNVKIHYADNGKGIPKDNLKKVFDPFFTTKRSQGSTGLGLSIAYNLVTQKLNGHISVESEPGKGSSFYIFFPKSVK